MTELHAVGVAAVLAANPDLQLVAGLAALFDTPAHKHANTLAVEGPEWVCAENSGFLFVYIVREEAASVVTGESHGGLRQVIGAEGEELRDFSDLPGQQSGTRQFDHGADDVIELHAGFPDQFIGHTARGLFEDREFLSVQNERVHDLRQYFNSGFLAFDSGFDDRAHLHLENFRIGDGQTAATMAEHRVGFVQLLNAPGNSVDVDLQVAGQLFLLGAIVRDEFVKRRVDQTDGDRESVHGFED